MRVVSLVPKAIQRTIASTRDMLTPSVNRGHQAALFKRIQTLCAPVAIQRTMTGTIVVPARPSDHQETAEGGCTNRIREPTAINMRDVFSPGRGQPQVAFTKRAENTSDSHFEAAAMRACAHAHVAEVFGTSGDGKELLLEAGKVDLFDHTRASEECKLNPDEVLRYTKQVAKAIAHMHGLGWTHNDIKPENVVLFQNPEGSPHKIAKLIDFEFARIKGIGDPSLDHLATGTLAYNAPEKQAEFDNAEWSYVYNDEAAADMWSLGATVHLAALGCFPNGTVKPRPHLHQDWRAPVKLDWRVGQLLEGLLRVNPRKRWKAEEVVQWLERSVDCDRIHHGAPRVNMGRITAV